MTEFEYNRDDIPQEVLLEIVLEFNRNFASASGKSRTLSGFIESLSKNDAYHNLIPGERWHVAPINR